MNTGVALEVGINIAGRLFSWNTQLPGQAEIADAVDDAEVNGFGMRALLRCYLFKGMPSTSAAVLLWISSLFRKALIRLSSPDIWASTRSSTWE